MIFYDFRNSETVPLGLKYPDDDKEWAKEILIYDGPNKSPSIKDGRICKYDCHARLLPHESDGICCNHGQVIETKLLN